MIFFSNNLVYLRERAGFTQKELSDILGVKPGTISNYEKGKSAPDFEKLAQLIKILRVNAQEILFTDIEKSAQTGLDVPQNMARDFAGPYKTTRYLSRTDRVVDQQFIPLYELEATAGLIGLFLDSGQSPIDYITIPDLPLCDGAVYVRGDSMSPLLKSGDIVLYKKVPDIATGIFWGEMYLVSFDFGDEQFIAIKYIKKSSTEGYIRLESHNADYEPQEVELSRIRALGLIKASIRYNTMG